MYSEFNVIIVAGGLGSRMQSSIPKQFLEIHQRPVIVHTISRFLEINDNLFFSIAAPHEHIKVMEDTMAKHFPGKNILICQGGATRFHSVQNALQHCPAPYVMIHDAVRPCIDSNWLRGIMDFTRKNKAAIPYIKMTDSIRKSVQGQYIVMNRDEYIRIQTPQCFDTELLKNAFDQGYNELFTDDASVWESAGYELFFYEGLERNIKITTPDDIRLASHFLNP